MMGKIIFYMISTKEINEMLLDDYNEEDYEGPCNDQAFSVDDSNDFMISEMMYLCFD